MDIVSDLLIGSYDIFGVTFSRRKVLQKKNVKRRDILWHQLKV